MKPKHPIIFLLVETSHPLLSGVHGMLQILCLHFRFCWENQSIDPTKIPATAGLDGQNLWVSSAALFSAPRLSPDSAATTLGCRDEPLSKELSR